jgi:uncharacterized glyoxalase superfamily protein PhnB
MQIQPYLFFEGRCEEAVEFYRRALGAEVEMLLRFKDSPEPTMAPPGAGDKVMHMSLRIGGTTVLASDVRHTCCRACAAASSPSVAAAHAGGRHISVRRSTNRRRSP